MILETLEVALLDAYAADLRAPIARVLRDLSASVIVVTIHDHLTAAATADDLHLTIPAHQSLTAAATIHAGLLLAAQPTAAATPPREVPRQLHVAATPATTPDHLHRTARATAAAATANRVLAAAAARRSLPAADATPPASLRRRARRLRAAAIAASPKTTTARAPATVGMPRRRRRLVVGALAAIRVPLSRREGAIRGKESGGLSFDGSVIRVLRRCRSLCEVRGGVGVGIEKCCVWNQCCCGLSVKCNSGCVLKTVSYLSMIR